MSCSHDDHLHVFGILFAMFTFFCVLVLSDTVNQNRKEVLALRQHVAPLEEHVCHGEEPYATQILLPMQEENQDQ